MSNFYNTMKKAGTALMAVVLLTACGGGGGSTSKFTLNLHAGDGYFESDTNYKLYKRTYSSFIAGNWYDLPSPSINDDDRVFATWYFDEECRRPVSAADIERYCCCACLVVK